LQKLGSVRTTIGQALLNGPARVVQTNGLRV
jgi:hypothetical protein